MDGNCRFKCTRTKELGNDMLPKKICRCPDHDGCFQLRRAGGIGSVVYKRLNLVDNALAVSGIGHAKPFAGGVEHFNSRCALVDQLVDHQRNKELSLFVLHILGIRKELFEVGSLWAK